VVLAGMQKLIWRNRDITQDELQVLSAEDRRGWSLD
jgi:hypothetical protein